MRRLAGVVLAFGALLVLAGCSGRTTGATNITELSATLHATGRCDKGQTCTWYWEYWPASQPRSSNVKTQVFGPVNGPTGHVALHEDITGLQPKTAYRWVFCASPNNGGVYACSGPNGTFGSTTADPPPDYATFTTPPFRTLAERWDGTSWTIQTTSNPTSPNPTLSSVSCTSPTACMAVGDYSDSAGDRLLLAERWDGTSWTIEPTPNPAGSHFSVLSAVSCTSATACIAVGTNYTDNGGTALGVLVERWDGASWAIQSTPAPPGGRPTLRGVSCTSAMACTAVGFYDSNSGLPQTLAERWDGTNWTIQTTANYGIYGGSTFYPLITTLVGVSCASPTACAAVGGYVDQTGQNHTVAETWNGTTWALEFPQDPTDAKSGYFLGLSDVSCSSPAACTAVASYTNAAGENVTLAERWNGTSWTIQPTPTPSGAQGSGLNGVSCSSDTACTAVGGYNSSAGTDSTLAERWDGTTWTIQPTPNKAGGFGLSAVSCSSDTACTAVGRY